MSEVGEIVEKPGYYHFVEWNIEEWRIYFLLGSREKGKQLRSLSFSCSGELWYLKLSLEKDASDKHTEWLGLYLVKEDAGIDSKLAVRFSLGLKASDGTIHESMSTTHCFSNLCDFCGWTNAIEKEELIRKRSTICPNGIITFWCMIHLEEEYLSDAEPHALPRDGKRIKHEDKAIQVDVIKENWTIESDICRPNGIQENNEELVEQSDETSGIQENNQELVENCDETNGIQGNTEDVVKQDEVLKGIQETDQELYQPGEVSNDLDGLTTALVGFFLNKKSCDVTILIGDYCFEAHRLILAIRSPIFAAKFKNTMEQRNIVYHTDCDSDAFYKFLLYLYSSKIEDISIDLVVKLYGIATEYKVLPLIKTCATYMINNISVDAFCDIFLVAQTHGEVELLQTLKDFFVTNMGCILTTKTWQTFLNEHTNLVNDLLIHVSNYTSTQHVCSHI